MFPATTLQLQCPFPSAINPHAELIEQQSIEWGCQQGIIFGRAIHAVRASKAGHLVAWAYPRAQRDHLQLVADWNIWLLIWDDWCGSMGIGTNPFQLKASLDRFLAILEGAAAAPADGPMGASLANLRDRLCAQGGRRWMRRFVDSVAEVFEVCIWEAENRAYERLPTVAEYLEKRPIAGALYPYLELADITEQIDLPAEVRAHPLIRRLTLAANNIICWANDLVSLEKDIQEGEFHNLIILIQKEQRLSISQATKRVIDLHNAEVQMFLTTSTQLPSFGAAVDRDLARYIAVLTHWMRANMNWIAVSGRYQQKREAISA